GQLALWEVSTGKQLWARDTGATLHPVGFLDGGAKFLVYSDIAALELWDTASGRMLHRFAERDAEGAIGNSVLSGDGRHVLTGRYLNYQKPTAIEVWDAL